MDYILIEDQDALHDMVAQCADIDVLAIDTEFIRQRTYYPILGLFQLYNGKQTFLIDPLAIDNLSPLWLLLDRHSVVLHACSEDLDVFQTEMKKIPDNFHDSQLAAAFAGLGASLGFGGMVSHFEGIELDKGASRSNWLARPLADKQLDYAAADVFHLLPCWEKLITLLHERHYYDFYLQEVQNLRTKKLKQKDPAQVYKQFKNASFLNPRQLATLQILGEWREKNAVARDMAVNFVVKEAHLVEVAKHQPKSLFELNQLGLLPIEIKRHGKVILEMVKKAQKLTDEQLPAEMIRISDRAGYKKLVQKLKVKIADVAESSGIPAELIGSKKLINELLTWIWVHESSPNRDKPLLLSNWRAEVVGNKLLTLITPN